MQPLIPFDPGFYKELLDQMSDGVYFVDRNRQILYWNEGAFRLTGYTSDELVGRFCQDDVLCHVDYEGTSLCHEQCPLSKCISDGGARQASVFLRHKQGRRVPVAVRVQPIRDADGSVVGAVEIFSDDTARNEAQRKIDVMRRMAFLDHLTQLPNRRYMESALETALTEFKFQDDPFGLLLADIDDFKKVNDTLGHVCGDHALEEVARTIVAALRPVDIVGRWGGDEFLAIVRNVNPEILRVLADRCTTIVANVAVPGSDDNRAQITVSVGAALARRGDTSAALIHRADRFMYQSKAAGRGRAVAG